MEWNGAACGYSQRGDGTGWGAGVGVYKERGFGCQYLACSYKYFSVNFNKFPLSLARNRFQVASRQTMLTTALLATVATLSTGVQAHFRVLEPEWRGSSFEEPASQWIYPCANVNETTDIANRTHWPLTGGSLLINASHEHALTAVNMAFGPNATSFNVSLVEMFNQTGTGLFCMKETGKAVLAQAFMDAGFGEGEGAGEGVLATVQVIQLGHSGSALYNCADIMFNSSAELLSDDQCQNDTGVSGVGNEKDGNRMFGMLLMEGLALFWLGKGVKACNLPS
ncbi:hypothetical protein BDW02DRAFT_192546 [Decorospora gaudefroyi]|uniref:Copper acquisition factor BIM1-like domain-containing protein n=1 Tax=Decorospora gaudefroyi TaxID=184978 RepID=A0A6A5JYY8_9PLEO|nr:hypothetical protein BDW02DRAFT_192546 [Decorospora gaudefroyi]